MNEILEEVALKLNLPIDTVEVVMRTYFNFIKYKLCKVHYRNLLSFNRIRTNFSLMGFGKLVVKNKTDKRLQNEKRFKAIKCKGNV